jgi:hypothetical protein
MRAFRLLSLVFAFGILAACGNLSPVASDDDEGVCSSETPQYCEGYIGSDT